jgi:hypothetical protein
MCKHLWRFTDINNNVYENEFLFDEFKWGNIPTAKKTETLILHFNTIELGPED